MPQPHPEPENESLSLRSRRRGEISTGVRYVVTLLLFFGGIFVLAQAFNFPGLEAGVFMGGLLMITGGLAFAIHA